MPDTTADLGEVVYIREPDPNGRATTYRAIFAAALDQWLAFGTVRQVDLDVDHAAVQRELMAEWAREGGDPTESHLVVGVVADGRWTVWFTPDTPPPVPGSNEGTTEPTDWFQQVILDMDRPYTAADRERDIAYAERAIRKLNTDIARYDRHCVTRERKLPALVAYVRAHPDESVTALKRELAGQVTGVDEALDYAVTTGVLCAHDVPGRVRRSAYGHRHRQYRVRDECALDHADEPPQDPYVGARVVAVAERNALARWLADLRNQGQS